MDVHTKSQRSYNMSRIRSKWTKPEITVHNYLKGRKIRHRMHPEMQGSPDILLLDSKTAIFIHGCFWHRCPEHFRMPKTRVRYWSEKINANTKRDTDAVRKLKSKGWKVIRIWEHDIRKNHWRQSISSPG